MSLVEEILNGSAKQFVSQIEEKLPNKKLKTMFRKCFLNTLETTVRTPDDGSLSVITGDIDAMWLRDSSSQVKQYLFLAKGDSCVQKLFDKLIAKQISFVLNDPYANAFNPTPNGAGHIDDITEMNPSVFERKYEIDSLCYPIDLSYNYWKESGDTEVFTSDYYKALIVMLSVFKTEQHHENSNYSFERRNCPKSDTLKNNGRGTAVNYTGMSWTGFRPSDDAAEYGYNIPENMFLSEVLSKIQEISKEIYHDKKIYDDSKKLQKEIDEGIKKYGITENKDFGKIYAYETDGFGNYNLMDDANVPNLLGIPYYGYKGTDKEIYKNTRKFVLSKINPYYFCGESACGLGSPHTPNGFIWPIGLIIEALTSDDDKEIAGILKTLMKTDAETDFMHESFNCNDPKDYTRSWFAWANSLFSYFIIELCNKNFDFTLLI